MKKALAGFIRFNYDSRKLHISIESSTECMHNKSASSDATYD